jgi:hypothetical protein
MIGWSDFPESYLGDVACVSYMDKYVNVIADLAEVIILGHGHTHLFHQLLIVHLMPITHSVPWISVILVFDDHRPELRQEGEVRHPR